LGATNPVSFDARVIAASKKDLRKEVAAGNFREDLYYRLSVVTVRLPPLHERLEDIPMLFDGFSADQESFDKLPENIRNRWLNHTWPGNVRELRNAAERYMALQDDGLTIVPAVRSTHTQAGTLSPNYGLPFKEAKEKLLESFEREYLRRLLDRSTGGVAGAARQAGIDRKHLYSLLAKHGLAKPGK
jgi:DNA-binding NtrC family response regulator